MLDLFNVTRGNVAHLGGARAANADEVLAYVHWLRAKRGLPDFGSLELNWNGVRRRRFDRGACIGATFGARTRGEYEPGAYTMLLPGYDAHRQLVTFEGLNDAGDVVTSSTLPIEPKKGGVIWSRDEVRKAAGPVIKPRKGNRPCPPEELAPTPCETSPPAATAERPAESFDPCPGTLQAEAQETPSAAAIGHQAQDFSVLLDLIATMEARLVTLESERAEPQPETRTDVSAQEPLSHRKRTLAHERAVRRAWADRRAQREETEELRRCLAAEIAAREALEFERVEMQTRLAAAELAAREPRALYEAELDRLTARVVFLENEKIERLSAGRIRLNMPPVQPSRSSVIRMAS